MTLTVPSPIFSYEDKIYPSARIRSNHRQHGIAAATKFTAACVLNLKSEMRKATPKQAPEPLAPKLHAEHWRELHHQWQHRRSGERRPIRNCQGDDVLLRSESFNSGPLKPAYCTLDQDMLPFPRQSCLPRMMPMQETTTKFRDSSLRTINRS